MSSIPNREKLTKTNGFLLYLSKDNKTKNIINNNIKGINKPINKLEDYTEIIPQKIQNIQKSNTISEIFLNLNKESEIPIENYDNQNLEFSFGKEQQKDNIVINSNINKDNNYSEKTDANTNVNSLKIKLNNTINHDKRDFFNENLSSYQFTDSLSNYNIEENKKLKLIKEKFLSNFKNKDRSISLEKALKFFEKFQNYQKYNLNHSFTNLKDITPYKHLMKQNTNSLSFLDNKHKNKSSFNKLEIEHINNKLKMKKENNLKTLNIKNNDKKLFFTKLVSRNKGQDKKLINLKDNKKKGFYIRKVIREEQYFVDDDGTEKLIGIKQSTFDSKEKNTKKDIMTKNISKNVILLNKKKFAEFLKEKISNKKINKSILFQNKSKNSFNKNIQINTDFINNNKNLNGDNCNNIKIVINKINKINSNPKIKLNFIKNYKTKKRKEQNCLTSRDNQKIVYKTEINNNNTFHLIKIDKFKNENKLEFKPLIANININSYQDRAKLKDKLKIVNCEKVNKLQHHILDKKIINSYKNIYSSNPKIIPQKIQKSNKRNYSFKEIRNLSNNIIYKTHLSNKTLQNKNNKFLIIDLSSNNNKCKFKRIPIQNNSLHKNKLNHTHYESKSFSCKKQNSKKLQYKIEKQKIMKNLRYRKENYNNLDILNNNKRINTNLTYFYKTELTNNCDEDNNILKTNSNYNNDNNRRNKLQIQC